VDPQRLDRAQGAAELHRRPSCKKQGYTEVFTPHIGGLELYKTSGHFPYYKDSQFAPIIEREALES
jgi:threonyl-tRNA synthetase